MKTNYESPLEHSSSPDGCREDCPACEDERLHELPKPYPGPFWFDAEDGTICFRDEHQTVCRLADVPDYDDPMQAATAAHIVLCVNSHDALLAACKQVKAWLESGVAFTGPNGPETAAFPVQWLESAIQKATP